MAYAIRFRIFFAAWPELLTPALRIVRRAIAGLRIRRVGFKHATADTGAVNLDPDVPDRLGA